MTVKVPQPISARNQELLRWYGVHARDLPWRNTDDPYRVLVSEIMLQQTQVSRATPKFIAFVERWPTVADLAEATNEEILSQWSGLGYNSRALRLRDAAQVVAKDGWPTTPAGLRALPGVGPYTANAVASICFGAEVPAVDTNLRRVLSRWFGSSLTGPELVEYADTVVGSPAGDWNQALMDLGSTVCLPRNPLCHECPVSETCSNPDVYLAPARQPRFEGSNRQLRGAIVRASLEGRDPVEAGLGLGRTPTEIENAINRLVSEGLIKP